ncbi:unnamed protein product [Gongylonema pulchrum]|nr:unnamed protein product [Gongylonema pulchrum]
MLFNQYGNYVVQTLINVSMDVLADRRPGQQSWFTHVVDHVVKHASDLRKYTFGKKILQKLSECGVEFEIPLF